MGKPVALEASAEEREVRGLISMTTTRPVFGIVRELDVGAADDLDGLDDVVGILLQLLLQLGVDGQHRRGAVGIAGVHAHGVDVLDEADRDHLVLGVADDLQFQFLPAEHGFLDQDLADQAGGEAAAGDDAQFLDVVDEAAARAAHGVGRTDDDRVAEFGGDLFGLLDADRRARSRACRCRARFMVSLKAMRSSPRSMASAWTPMTCTPYFSSTPALCELGGEVEAGLAAQVGQQGVGPFLLDDLGQASAR